MTSGEFFAIILIDGAIKRPLLTIKQSIKINKNLNTHREEKERYKMSEFGNETVTAMMKLGEKGLELAEKLLQKLFQLLKFISETKERRLSKELKTAEFEKVKKTRSVEDAREYLNRTRGLVKAKYMQRAGKDLYPISQPMSPTELKRFNRLARTNGLNYYTLQNEAVIEKYTDLKKELRGLEKLQKDTDGGLSTEQLERKMQLEKQLANLEKQRNDVIVVVFKEDLALVENITERMNMEIDLSDIDRETEMLKGKEVLTDEDKQRLDELSKQRQDIINAEFNKFNNDNAAEIINGALNKDEIEHDMESLSFEKAINKTCDRDYAIEPCYMCDRNNPDNYIVAKNEKMLNQEGLPYNNTSFAVYNNGQPLDKTYYRQSTLDGRQTSTRGEQVWSNIKKEIKDKGGFSDDLVIFSNKNDYLKYKREYEIAKVQGAEEVKREAEQAKAVAEKRLNREDTIGVEADSNSYRDYGGMINRLKAQLADHKMMLNEQGQICDSDTLEEVDVTNIENDDEKKKFAECINIGKQIEVLKKLNDAQTRIAFIENQQALNTENYNKSGKSESMKEMYENMRSTLHKQSYELSTSTAIWAHQLYKLEDELNDLRSVSIVENIQKENENTARKHAAEQRTTEKKIEEKEDIREDITHREEHTLSKEQWEKSVSQGNKVAESVSTEKTLEITNERE